MRSVFVLVAGCNLIQGCDSGAKNDVITLQNQKIDALSAKLDSVLQGQHDLQNQESIIESKSQINAANQQDSIVNRIAASNYYYATNLINETDLGTQTDTRNFENAFSSLYRMEKQLDAMKDQADQIEREIKPQYGGDFQSIGDKIDSLKRTVDGLQADNEKIKLKLGIIY